MKTGMLILSSEESKISSFLQSTDKPYYVYLLHRPGVGPFYVGKGSRNRLFCHAADAQNTSDKNYKLNIIRLIRSKGQALVYEIDALFDTEQEAFDRERDLIRGIGRYDLLEGPLANMTDGGEGQSNPSKETQDKQRACWSGVEGDSDYALVNRFFTRYVPATKAVPIKPLEKLGVLPLTPHSVARSITKRQCAALLASIVTHRIMLAPDCEVPRWLTYGGVEFVIENGVGRDILKSGTATLSSRSLPCKEVFRMSQEGYIATIQYFGRAFLESEGVLAPS